MPARLLLADDSITIQRVIELTFADEDVTVTAVSDGASAIARLDAEPPDIVLADIGMPGASGYEVAAHVRQTPSLAHIPVLLLTGASEPADDARVQALGCAGVLAKPFEPQMVIARVRELLARGRRAEAPDRTHPAAATERAESAEVTASAEVRGDTPPRRQASPDVDQYFAELDAAFANLAAAPEGGSPKAPIARREAEERAGGAPDTAPGAITMAGAFEALLGAEQGEPLPPFMSPAALTTQRQEAIAARAATEAAERIVREVAPALVSEIAERLVREEIERLKASASGETGSSVGR